MPTKRSKIRIACVVPSASLVFRGVGNFCVNLFDLAEEYGWIVDVILDAPPRDNDLYRTYKGLNWVYPDDPIPYKTHTDLFFWRDNLNLEKVMNFRNAMVKALKSYSYELVIANTGDALLACYYLRLGLYTNLLYYTHHESAACMDYKHDIYTPETSGLFRIFDTLPGIVVGTQTSPNRSRIRALLGKNIRVAVLPYLVDKEVYNQPKPAFDKTWGVGFVGPYEPRKAPELYIKALEEANLPAVVLTTTTSAKKFEKELKSRRIEHKIYADIMGKEKAEAIASMRSAYHPSYVETFGLGVFETAHFCPTLVLKNRQWSSNHSNWTIQVSADEAPAILQRVYSGKIEGPDSREILEEWRLKTREKWKSFVEDVCAYTKDKKPQRHNLIDAVKSTGQLKVAEWTAGIQGKFTNDEYGKVLRFRQNPASGVVHTQKSTYLFFKYARMK